MVSSLTPYLLHWGISALALWSASRVFRGLQFADTPTVLVSALLLGVAHAVLRPLMIVLTLPLTLMTFGLFLLVINACMLLLVARMVRGFSCDGFRTALLASIFIGIVSMVLERWLIPPELALAPPMPHSGLWL